MTDKYRYQGQDVTLVNHDEQSTECTIRLPDGTEKTVSKDEIQVEHSEQSQREVPQTPAQNVDPNKAG